MAGIMEIGQESSARRILHGLWYGWASMVRYIEHNNKNDIFIAASIWNRAFACRLNLIFQSSAFACDGIRYVSKLNWFLDWTSPGMLSLSLPCWFRRLSRRLQNKSKRIPLKTKWNTKSALFMQYHFKRLQKKNRKRRISNDLYDDWVIRNGRFWYKLQ